MRLFIAVELPSSIQSKLAEKIEIFKNPKDKITWVQPQNIHLTLKFLGDVSEEKVAQIKDAISSASLLFKPNACIIKGFGVFPDTRNPRVFWAGITDGADEIKGIAKELENRLEKMGFPAEKRDFVPHLTLGRIKFIKDAKYFDGLLENHKDDLIADAVVRNILLVKSTLTQGGSIYTIIQKSELVIV